MSHNHVTKTYAPITIQHLVPDHLRCGNAVFAFWPARLSLFTESPGDDRAGSLVAIALPWLLLFRTTGKGLCLSRPTNPPPLLPWLAWSVYSESFSPVQLPFILRCPNGHHVTFFRPVRYQQGFFLTAHCDRLVELCDYINSQQENYSDAFLLRTIHVTLLSYHA